MLSIYIYFLPLATTIPFQIQFKTDADEVTSPVAIKGGVVVSTTNEQAVAPSGIVGFSLNYVETTCPPVTG